MRTRSTDTLSLLPALLPALLLALVALSFSPVRARAEPEPRPIGRVTVKEDGFVRVTAAALARLGAPDVSRVEVRRRGRPVPLAAGAATQDLVFLAEGHATDHSAWGVYELWLLPAARPAAVAAAPPVSGEESRPSARRVHDADHVHGPIAAGRGEVYDHPRAPTWFLAVVEPGRAVSTDLDPMGAAEATPQRLEVEVWATRIGEVALEARWGGHELGLSSHPSAAGGAVFRWLVPADAVPSEGTALELRDVSPPAPAPPVQDISNHRGRLWVESLALTGEVTPTVDGRLRVFDVKAHSTLTLAGDAARAHHALVGPGGGPLPTAREADVEVRQGAFIPDGVPFVFPADGRFFVSTKVVEIDPVPATPADPLARAGAARHVILAVPALLEPARRLAAHRTAHGLPSAVVPVEEVYARYGHGEATPAAIRHFLMACTRRGRAPLDYVLLAGDATADRTDMIAETTIPVPMARTIYNGATPADRLYVVPLGSTTGGPAIGRLPFRDAETMDAFVDRLIAYETRPPADPSRRLLRFVTNEARFGLLIDRLIETMFRAIVTTNIPPAYDIEVTFASRTSPYLWPPPEFNDKVIHGFNEGCLFYTYVGHGFARGFDSLRVGDERFPVLHVDSAGRVACEGTPPAVFVVACTTAKFDHPQSLGIGEVLIANPRGPIAYWGATRICHPAANTLLGRSIARFMSREEGRWRLGDILSRARDDVLDPKDDPQRAMIDMVLGGLAKGASPARLALEGTWMYTLLGDPATKIAVPASDLEVDVRVDEDRTLRISATSPLPDGVEIHLSLEEQRSRRANEPEPVADPLDPASYDAIRENHRRVNDLARARRVAPLAGGRVDWTLPLTPEVPSRKLVVKAWAIHDGEIHQGAAVVEIPEAPAEDDDDGDGE